MYPQPCWDKLSGPLASVFNCVLNLLGPLTTLPTLLNPHSDNCRSRRHLCKTFQSVQSVCKHTSQVSSDFLSPVWGAASAEKRNLRTCHKSDAQTEAQRLWNWCKLLLMCSHTHIVGTTLHMVLRSMSYFMIIARAIHTSYIWFKSKLSNWDHDSSLVMKDHAKCMC